MNDKLFARNYIGQNIKTPGSLVLTPSSCTDYQFVKNIFGNEASNFVIQASKGAGGNESYFLSENNTPIIKNKVAHLLVSPYYTNVTSVNTHIILSKNDFRIMPPSIQITLNKFKYSGSDFVAYNNLNKKIKKNIIECAKTIATKVQELSCKGVLGIDLIIDNDDVMFIECNYRYQGSSFVLNKALVENNMPSLFQCQYNAFYKDLSNIPKDIYDLAINYSSFRRTNWNNHINIPYPYKIIEPNNSTNTSSDEYQQYELYSHSIIQTIEKQEELNPYLFDL